MQDKSKKRIQTAMQLMQSFYANDRDSKFAEDFAHKFRTIMTYFKCAIKEVKTKFEVLDEEFSMIHDRNPISGIKSRLKSPDSIIEKMQRKNIAHDLESMQDEIADIAGIRVVCPFTADVYYLEKALLDQDDITLIKRKDYIKSPKDNGYRSLHLLVEVPVFLSQGKRPMKVEVQIRTIAMDTWASLEHQLRYKKDHDFTEETEKELKECADISCELDRKMDELRKKLIK